MYVSACVLVSGAVLEGLQAKLLGALASGALDCLQVFVCVCEGALPFKLCACEYLFFFFFSFLHTFLLSIFFFIYFAFN